MSGLKGFQIKRSGRGRKGNIGIIVTLLILAAIGGAIYFFYGKVQGEMDAHEPPTIEEIRERETSPEGHKYLNEMEETVDIR